MVVQNYFLYFPMTLLKIDSKVGRGVSTTAQMYSRSIAESAGHTPTPTPTHPGLIPTILHSPLYWESRDGCQWSSFLAELLTCTHTTPPQDLHILIQSHTAMQIERRAVQFDDHCPVSPQNHYNNLPCAVQVTLCCVNSECVLQ